MSYDTFGRTGMSLRSRYFRFTKTNVGYLIGILWIFFQFLHYRNLAGAPSLEGDDVQALASVAPRVAGGSVPLETSTLVGSSSEQDEEEEVLTTNYDTEMETRFAEDEEDGALTPMYDTEEEPSSAEDEEEGALTPKDDSEVPADAQDEETVEGGIFAVAEKEQPDSKDSGMDREHDDDNQYNGEQEQVQDDEQGVEAEHSPIEPEENSGGMLSQIQSEGEPESARDAGASEADVAEDEEESKTEHKSEGDGEGEGEQVVEGSEDSTESLPPKRPPCRCQQGQAVDCHTPRTPKTAGHFNNLAVAAICGVQQELMAARREERQARHVAANHTHVGWSNSSKTPTTREGDAVLQYWQGFDPRKAEQQEARAAAGPSNEDRLEVAAARLVLAALLPLVHPASSEGLEARDMFRENWFYTAENHERLREEKDPFRPDSVPFLPHAADIDNKTYQRCAVVGNSGVMTGTNYGEEIDAYDFVLRLNQAPTKGYAHDVGGRLNMRLLNKKWSGIFGRHRSDLIGEDRPRGPDNPHSRVAPDYRLVVTRANVREFLYVARGAAKMTKPKVEVRFLTTRVASHALALIAAFRKGMQEATGKRYRGGNAASSGFMGTFLMLQQCRHLSVYGFSLEECRGTGCAKPYHYFHNYVDSEWLRAHPSHSFSIEALVLKAMDKEGALCLVKDHGTEGTSKCATFGAGG